MGSAFVISFLVFAVDPAWEGPPEPQAVRVPTRAAQRLEAFDQLQAAVEQWERERRGFLAEQVLQQRAREHLQRSMAQSTELPPEALKHFTVIEADRKQTRGKPTKSRAKVIELPERDKLDVELEQAEAEVEAKRARCQADPRKCAAEKKQRAALEAGNDAFEQAIEVNFEKRRAEIEAEAQRFQAQVNAARRRAELREAQKLGGTLDEDGNFVDPEIEPRPK